MITQRAEDELCARRLFFATEDRIENIVQCIEEILSAPCSKDKKRDRAFAIARALDLTEARGIKEANNYLCRLSWESQDGLWSAKGKRSRRVKRLKVVQVKISVVNVDDTPKIQVREVS